MYFTVVRIALYKIVKEEKREEDKGEEVEENGKEHDRGKIGS